MPLSLKFQILASGSSGITIADATGNYDAQTNPGGWGGPNPEPSQVAGILVSLTALSLPEAAVLRLVSGDQTNYLNGTGYVIPPPAGNMITDGVYVIDVRIGFLNSVLLSAAAGSFQFTATSADALFADQDGFTIDVLQPEQYFRIDQTQPPTSVGGFVTTPLFVIVAQEPTIYALISQNVLISQQGLACLNRDIAGYAGTCQCCAGEDLDSLMVRYAEYLSMNNKFSLYGDLPGASALAKKLAADCGPKPGICSPLGTQPNIPFTGNAPRITMQPENVNVAQGAQVAFAVAATGTAPLIYQWYFDGVVIPGATGSTLSILNAQEPNVGTYYCVVSNAFGSVQSGTVSLTIGAGSQPVAIVTQPANQSGTIGATTNFAVVASGTGPITYQWYFNGVAIGGATAAALAIANTQLGNVGNYYCVVSNAVNSVQSNTVALTIGVEVFWGWSAAAPATAGQIQAGQGSDSIVSGSTITANFIPNVAPNVLWMAEPVTEPIKTKWFGDPLNNGAIGNPATDTFLFTVVGSYRLYYTQFQTLQTLEPLQFLVS